jgi:hypothetical protein
MDKFLAVMEGPLGRGLRIALGIVLIYLGSARIGGVGGAILAIAALLPIVTGLWGPCLAGVAIRGLKRA